jgi:hypothetical protein
LLDFGKGSDQSFQFGPVRGPAGKGAFAKTPMLRAE